MMRHLPQRPSWDCRVCGRPWPCPPAREYLTDRMGQTYRLQYLAGFYADAAGDLPDVPLVDLWQRFLAWARG